MAVSVLIAVATFTSCEDVLGHWDAPALPESTTLTITSDDLKLFVGDSETRVGTASSGASVTYSTSDANVATVDANGKVTAIANGTATITASAPFYNHCYGATATYQVIVSTIDVRLNPLYYVAEKDVESISAGRLWAVLPMELQAMIRTGMQVLLQTPAEVLRIPCLA